jgi:mannose-6-phosphate isomerase-like protein (cupin superfamily)
MELFIDKVVEKYKLSERSVTRVREHMEGKNSVYEKLTDKPYGSHSWLEELTEDDARICRLVLNPLTSTSLHYHKIKSHFFYVETGELSLTLNNAVIKKFNEGQFCFIDKNDIHLIENQANGPLHLLEVMHPALFDDKIMISHPYIEKQAVNALREVWPDSTNSMIQEFLNYCSKTSRELVEMAEISISKPYGWNHIISLHPDYGISFMKMNPREATSFHKHSQRKEFFFVRCGVLTLKTQDDLRILNQFSYGLSTPLSEHSLTNNGDEVLEVLEIFTPCLLDDKQRIDDRYARKLGDVKHLE